MTFSKDTGEDPPPMTGHNPRIEDSQTNFHWKFEGHTPRIEDFPDMGF